MKVSNFIIMFLVAIISYRSILSIHVQELNMMTNKYVQYNNNVDTAVDTAVSTSVESASSATELQVNLEGCVNTFYNSLYASFGASDNEILQQDLQLYTPIIALADVDGFYIMYNSVNSYGELMKVKTQKIPYVATFEKDLHGNTLHYSVAFTMGNEVTVTITRNGSTSSFTGDYSKLKEKYPGTILASVYDDTILSQPGTFNNWKTHTMSTQLCEMMNFYTMKNNQIAKDYGISYNFSLPESADTELANGLSNITFMVLFQGYPYGAGTTSTFNKFCVSGAHVTKMKVYYVRPIIENGDTHYYYHRSGCKELFDASIDTNGFYEAGNGLGYAFSSAQDAAASGAMPCPYCCY